jgi:hypothetical protein
VDDGDAALEKCIGELHDCRADQDRGATSW